MAQKVGGVGGLLPAEYQQVEWIQGDESAACSVIIPITKSTNTTYNNDVVRMSVDAEISSFKQGANFFGISNTGTSGLGLLLHENNELTIYRSNVNIGNVPTDTSRHLYTISPYGLYIDGELIVKTTQYSEFKYMALYHYPYHLNIYSYGTYGCDTKIYHAYLENEGVILYDLYPCYCKSDGEAGFYDIIGGMFYTNQFGGSLTLGPKI